MNKNLRQLVFLFSALCLSAQCMASLSPGLTVTTTPPGLSWLFNDWAREDPAASAFPLNTDVLFELSRPLSRFLFQWDNGANGDVDDTAWGNPPRNYRIEVSSDGNSWRTAADVPNNAVTRRAHEITGENIRWIRFRVAGPNNATIHEIDIHDMSQCQPGGACDTWAFIGDSITATTFWRQAAQATPFNVLVNQCAPSRFPGMLNLGISNSQTSHETPRLSLLGRLQQTINDNQGIYYWAILIGTNNAVNNSSEEDRFRRDLDAIVDTLIRNGKQPILARLPWARSQSESSLELRNRIIDSVRAKYNLPAGPDLYARFFRQDQLLRDGLHPTWTDGVAAIQRLWADTACALGSGGPQPQPAVSAIVSGNNRNLSLSCRFQAPQPIRNTRKSIYVAAMLPDASAFFFLNNAGGWEQYLQGGWPAWRTEAMSASPYNIVLAQGQDVSGLPAGTQILVGWGNDAADVINRGQFENCYTIGN